MQINGIEIPDEGLTKQYITDPIGQTMYIVFTNVSVQAVSLEDFQAKVNSAHQEVIAAQVVADELATKLTELTDAIQAQPDPAVQVTP